MSKQTKLNIKKKVNDSKELIKVKSMSQTNYKLYEEITTETNNFKIKKLIDQYKAPYLIQIKNWEDLVKVIKMLYKQKVFKKYIVPFETKVKCNGSYFFIKGFNVRQSFLSLLIQKEHDVKQFFNTTHKEITETYFYTGKNKIFELENNAIKAGVYEVPLYKNVVKEENKDLKRVIITGHNKLKAIIDGEYYSRRVINNNIIFFKEEVVVKNNYDEVIKMLTDFCAGVDPNNDVTWQEFINDEARRLLSMDPNKILKELRGKV